MAETDEEAAEKWLAERYPFIERPYASGFSDGDVIQGFLAGAAWQENQDYIILQDWIHVCGQKDAELVAIREKARKLMADSEELRWPLEKLYMSTDPPTFWQRQREFIRELAGGK